MPSTDRNARLVARKGSILSSADMLAATAMRILVM
jgi:hypothetical protein